jgi:hypothetical protein
VLVIEVSLTPTEIMQAIHDNLSKDILSSESIFNSKPFDGSTSGKKFDIIRRRKSSNNGPTLYLHGVIIESKEPEITKIELSSYPDVSLLFLVFFLSIPLYFS